MFRPSRFPLLLGAGVLIVAAAFAAKAGAGSGFMAGAIGLYAVAAVLIVTRDPATHGHDRFGAANTVTLGRLIGTCLFAGLAVAKVDGLSVTPTLSVIALSAGIVLLLADGIDGWMARRSGMSSAFGARFDMEVDALLILVLAVIAWQTGKAGAWILFSGAARYLYVGAAAIWPALRTPVFPSLRRKTIAVIQGAILVALLAPAVTPPLSDALGLCGVVLLLYSFGVDILWQISGRATQTFAAVAGK